MLNVQKLISCGVLGHVRTKQIQRRNKVAIVLPIGHGKVWIKKNSSISSRHLAVLELLGQSSAFKFATLAWGGNKSRNKSHRVPRPLLNCFENPDIVHKTMQQFKKLQYGIFLKLGFSSASSQEAKWRNACHQTFPLYELTSEMCLLRFRRVSVLCAILLPFICMGMVVFFFM